MILPDVCVLDNFCATKDPQEVLDYTIDYTTILQSSTPDDAISISSWFIYNDDGSMTLSNASHDGLIAKIWTAGGGKLGNLVKLTNHITTTSGREYERTIKIRVYAK